MIANQARCRPGADLHFQPSSDASTLTAVNYSATKRIALTVFLLLPLLIQSCSSELLLETGEMISVTVASAGKSLSLPIDIVDDPRRAFASSARYFAACPTPVLSIPVPLGTERVDATLRVDNRPLYQRISVLLI